MLIEIQALIAVIGIVYVAAFSRAKHTKWILQLSSLQMIIYMISKLFEHEKFLTTVSFPIAIGIATFLVLSFFPKK